MMSRGWVGYLCSLLQPPRCAAHGRGEGKKVGEGVRNERSEDGFVNHLQASVEGLALVCSAPSLAYPVLQKGLLLHVNGLLFTLLFSSACGMHCRRDEGEIMGWTSSPQRPG